MPSMRDTRNGNNLALPYHSYNSDFPNHYNFGPRTNTYRKNNYYQRPFRNNNESNVKPIKPKNLDVDDSQKKNMVSQTGSTSKETQKSIEPIKQSNRLPKYDEPIINLEPLIKESKETLPWQPIPKPMPKLIKPEEEKTDPYLELQQLLTNDPKNWKKPFPLENGTAVIVQHFVERPTASCWVIQNEHEQKINVLLQKLKQLHCHVDAVARNVIIPNEVYCVERDNIYHRGEVLYYNPINSKEAFVRLIDDGRSFQTQISTIKDLRPQLKSINAFAIEINFENLIDVNVGQILRIEKAVTDAVGGINVKLGKEVTLASCRVDVAANVNAKFGKEEKPIEIELIPFPVNVPMELFCLDHSNIEMGYISACQHDRQKIESINGLSDKIKKYVETSDTIKKYLPRLEEICLAYHDSEKQWYRAECIKILNPNCVEVLFIDYGNMKIVNIFNVRKIVPEFMEPAIMHFCRMHGKFIIANYYPKLLVIPSE